MLADDAVLSEPRLVPIFYCAVGVIASVLIPSLAQSIRQQYEVQPKGTEGRLSRLASSFGRGLVRIWPHVRPSARLAAYALLVSLVVFAAQHDHIKTNWDAVIVGYCSCTILEKLR